MGMSEAAQNKPLKSTLNLPETAFAMKANLPQNEPATARDLAEDGTVRADSGGAGGVA